MKLISKRERRNALIMRQRLHAFRWWIRLTRRERMGFVTAPIAARMLCVSTQRVGELIKAKRLRAFRAWPCGSADPWLVSVESLIAAPTPMEVGRRKTLVGSEVSWVPGYEDPTDSGRWLKKD